MKILTLTLYDMIFLLANAITRNILFAFLYVNQWRKDLLWIRQLLIITSQDFIFCESEFEIMFTNIKMLLIQHGLHFNSALTEFNLTVVVECI